MHKICIQHHAILVFCYNFQKIASFILNLNYNDKFDGKKLKNIVFGWGKKSTEKNISQEEKSETPRKSQINC